MGAGVLPGTARPRGTRSQPARACAGALNRRDRMETRAHHVLIGAFTIAVFLLALGFVLWMSRSSTDDSYREYDIVFTEAVTGLSVGGLVQYNGIKVGEVRRLTLAPEDPRKVIAREELDAST